MNKIEYDIAKLIKKLHFRAVLNSNIPKNSKVYAEGQIVNSKISKHSNIGYDCIIINANISFFCSLEVNRIIGGANHSVGWVSTSTIFNENLDHLPQKFSHHKFDLNNNTNIGSDVWIGNNVLIKADVSIGDGVVIGMGSIVTKDIPPYEIWAGNPAKFIRKRFSDEIIFELLAIKWWAWEDREISKYAKYFNDVPSFLEQYKRHNKITNEQ